MRISGSNSITALFASGARNLKSQEEKDGKAYANNYSELELTKTKNTKTATSASDNNENTHSEAVKSIVNKYNLRAISYTDLESMTQELMEAGTLSKSDFLDFLPPSEEFASIDGSININWNESKDYVKSLEDSISFMKNYFPGMSTEHLEKQLNLKLQFTQDGS